MKFDPAKLNRTPRRITSTPPPPSKLEAVRENIRAATTVAQVRAALLSFLDDVYGRTDI